MPEAAPMNPKSEVSPVVIGGVGGSGTRVVSQIVSGMGWRLGESDLSGSLDYTGFTLLFKNAKWRLPKYSQRNEQAFELIRRQLEGEPCLTLRNLMLVLRATTLMVKKKNNDRGLKRWSWSLVRAKRLLMANKQSPEAGSLWGWKEPNSHIFLDQINTAFPNLRFIHTMRNGVDMAFSRNQWQMKKWSYLFDLPLLKSDSELPASSLRYWLAANRRTCELGERLGPKKFLALKFEDLCQNPAQEVERIADFLGRQLSNAERDLLAALPRTPSSMGRHRQHDLKQFSAADLEAVKEFGFDVGEV